MFTTNTLKAFDLSPGLEMTSRVLYAGHDCYIIRKKDLSAFHYVGYFFIELRNPNEDNYNVSERYW